MVLTKLLAHTAEQYVEIAVHLAQDRERLSTLRQGLRGRMERSPLLDHKQYTAQVEAALRAIWETWCRRRQ